MRDYIGVPLSIVSFVQGIFRREKGTVFSNRNSFFFIEGITHDLFRIRITSREAVVCLSLSPQQISFASFVFKHQNVFLVVVEVRGGGKNSTILVQGDTFTKIVTGLFSTNAFPQFDPCSVAPLRGSYDTNIFLILRVVSTGGPRQDCEEEKSIE